MGATSDRSTKIERKSDREIVVTRTFNAPARIVYEAWTKPDLFMKWWAPKSIGMPMVGCEMDVRVGRGYSVTFQRDASNTMTFFGKYVEVVPNARLVWTNEEGEDGAVTTVTFEDRGGETLLTMSELYPSKEALDAAQGAMDAAPEQFDQLEALLAAL
jgi:uncharacterized protein YndB with AHSA1/START domain